MRISIEISPVTLHVALLLAFAGLAAYFGYTFGNGMDPDSAGYAALGLEMLGEVIIVPATICVLLFLALGLRKWAYWFFVPVLFIVVFLFTLSHLHR